MGGKRPVIKSCAGLGRRSEDASSAGPRWKKRRKKAFPSSARRKRAKQNIAREEGVAGAVRSLLDPYRLPHEEYLAVRKVNILLNYGDMKLALKWCRALQPGDRLPAALCLQHGPDHIVDHALSAFLTQQLAIGQPKPEAPVPFILPPAALQSCGCAGCTLGLGARLRGWLALLRPHLAAAAWALAECYTAWRAKRLEQGLPLHEGDVFDQAFEEDMARRAAPLFGRDEDEDAGIISCDVCALVLGVHAYDQRGATHAFCDRHKQCGPEARVAADYVCLLSKDCMKALLLVQAVSPAHAMELFDRAKLQEQLPFLEKLPDVQPVADGAAPKASEQEEEPGPEPQRCQERGTEQPPAEQLRAPGPGPKPGPELEQGPEYDLIFCGTLGVRRMAVGSHLRQQRPLHPHPRQLSQQQQQPRQQPDPHQQPQHQPQQQQQPPPQQQQQQQQQRQQPAQPVLPQPPPLPPQPVLPQPPAPTQLPRKPLSPKPPKPRQQSFPQLRPACQGVAPFSELRGVELVEPLHVSATTAGAELHSTVAHSLAVGKPCLCRLGDGLFQASDVKEDIVKDTTTANADTRSCVTFDLRFEKHQGLLQVGEEMAAKWRACQAGEAQGGGTGGRESKSDSSGGGRGHGCKGGRSRTAGGSGGRDGTGISTRGRGRNAGGGSGCGEQGGGSSGGRSGGGDGSGGSCSGGRRSGTAVPSGELWTWGSYWTVADKYAVDDGHDRSVDRLRLFFAALMEGKLHAELIMETLYQVPVEPAERQALRQHVAAALRDGRLVGQLPHHVKLVNFPGDTVIDSLLPSLAEYAQAAVRCVLGGLMGEEDLVRFLPPGTYDRYKLYLNLAQSVTDVHIDDTAAWNLLLWAAVPDETVPIATWLFIHPSHVSALHAEMERRCPGRDKQQANQGAFFLRADFSCTPEEFITICTAAGIPVFAVYQRVGDVVLVPSYAPHVVWTHHPSLKMAADYLPVFGLPAALMLADQLGRAEAAMRTGKDGRYKKTLGNARARMGTTLHNADRAAPRLALEGLLVRETPAILAAVAAKGQALSVPWDRVAAMVAAGVGRTTALPPAPIRTVGKDKQAMLPYSKFTAPRHVALLPVMLSPAWEGGSGQAEAAHSGEAAAGGGGGEGAGGSSSGSEDEEEVGDDS